ncbi:MAG: YebC/PmpR family DNA-binding transcriptional regulator [Candidatus Dojkabacteria bacterium]|nr:YebC/PmpR family DNA-binding transcriptional regulator [Candidatus Dojkabacteria bacterium]
MSGHSKWATIKRKKGAADARRGKLFTKLGRTITIAAREGGGDPSSNFSLRLAVEKAREANMPMENIERAIKRGSGEGDGDTVQWEKGTYGGYGPGGVAVAVDVLTDNKNRTVSELRKIFEDNGGTFADASSVLWQFHEKGHVLIKCAKVRAGEKFGEGEREVQVDRDEATMELMDISGVEDIQENDDDGVCGIEVFTVAQDLARVRSAIEGIGFVVLSSEIAKIPERYQTLEKSDEEKLIQLVESIDDHDDVEDVWTTAE